MADRPFEWDYPRVLLVALAAVTLVALVVVGSTSAAAFGSHNPAWDGAAELRSVARDTGATVTVARDLDAYDGVDPERTMALVLAPAEPYSPSEAATLRRFVRNGGTLVVADDFGPHANRLLAALGADSRIEGTLLRDERHYYRAAALPVATNVTAHPFTARVDQLTLNYGSPVAPNGATALVRSSSFAYVDENRNGALDAEEELDTYPVVTTEPVGEGTLVVAGDPSLFINVMLERPGNAAFVRNLFGTGEVVVLDYSHAGGFPPLVLVLLILRGSVWAQLAAGLVGLGAIAVWAGGWGPRPWAGRTDEPPEGPGVTEAQLAAYLERRHPDWDEERVRRVVRGLKRDRPQSAVDE